MDIRDLTLEELGAELERMQEKRFRAAQIFDWLYKNSAPSRRPPSARRRKTMGNYVYNAKDEARGERRRETRDAGVMSDRFPGVSSIVVTMNYKGSRTTTLRRTVNFTPGSPAYFRISCLGEGCDRGALDLTWVISRMIRGQERSARGELACENQDPAIQHADVDYDASITYR